MNEKELRVKVAAELAAELEKRGHLDASRLVAKIAAVDWWWPADDGEGDECPECARSFGPHYSGECNH